MLDFDLVETVESTLDMMAERAHGRGIELAGAMQPAMPTRLRGDPGRLRQILFNLIGNAIKFTDSGEVVVTAFLESETERLVLVRFDVKDTGIGISAGAQVGLFEPFIQGDGSTTRKYGGTGLGLAICKQLVTMMNGQIGVESILEEGSNFWFTVQLEKQAGNAKSPRKYDHSLLDVRVLVVDDNATSRRILRHQILAWKMTPGTAASGSEALEFLRTAADTGKAYDLALLDVQMPDMDGFALARAIKADPAIAGTRLIVLTSREQGPSDAALKQARIEAHLVKPVRQARLFDCLVTAMASGPDLNTSPRVAEPLPGLIPEPKPKFENVRILLAEDNSINQRVALGQLEKLNYTANAVADGLEVLRSLEKISYRIILMDCQMPEMDGYEATRAIRKREQSFDQRCPWESPVYIIAMTANALENDRERCLAVGMDDYLSKPVQTSDLRAALERWKLTVYNQ
jgi:two-component system sensor histidine kinase/response regulator